METLERQDVVVAAAGVVALLVGLGSLLLVGAPATSMMELAVGGHGGIGGSSGMGGGPTSMTPVGWPTALAFVTLVGAAVAFGYVARRWWHVHRSAHASSEPSDTEPDRIEAIRSAYAQDELTEAELESALERELGGDKVVERSGSTETPRERTGEETAERE
jgi:hypothetical protein